MATTSSVRVFSGSAISQAMRARTASMVRLPAAFFERSSASISSCLPFSLGGARMPVFSTSFFTRLGARMAVQADTMAPSDSPDRHADCAPMVSMKASR